MNHRRVRLGTYLRRGRGRGASLLLVLVIAAVTALVGAPAADALDWNCKQPPTAEYPGASLVGHLDAPEVGRGKPTTPYGDYSYAGQKWFTYDTGCMGDPNAATDTQLGNEAFNVGKTIVAVINGAHWLQDSQGALKPLDDLVNELSVELYDNIFTPYIGLALIIAALSILVWTLRGNLAEVGRSTLMVLVALAVASATYLMPLTYTTLADGLLNDGVNQLQTKLLNSGEYSARDALPNTLHDHVVYQNWLKGEFGEDNSPEARQHGRELLDAQACSKIQTLDAELGRAPCPVGAKKAAFTKVGNELSNTPAYGFFTGTHGSRIGTGVGAILESVCYGAFQMLALFALFLAKVVLRVLVLGGPVIGLAAVVYHPVLEKAGRAAGTALTHGTVLAVASLVHLRILEWILGPREVGIGYIGQLLLAGVITAAFWMGIKPHRKFRNMLESSLRLGGFETMPWEQIMQQRFLRRMRRGQSRHESAEQDHSEQAYNTLVVAGTPRPESGTGRPNRVPADREHAPPYRSPGRALPGGQPPDTAGGSPSPPPPDDDGPRDGGGDSAGSGGGHGRHPQRQNPQPGHRRSPGQPRPDVPDTGGREPDIPETSQMSPRRTEPEVIWPSEYRASSRPESTSDTGPTADHRNGPEAAPSRQEGSTRVWRIYRPSSGRIEDDTSSDRGSPPDRPESRREE